MYGMDLRVYTKEEAPQPRGGGHYYVPNVIDIHPQIRVGDDGVEVLAGADILSDDEASVEQECALSTIWQRGNDPVSPGVGVRWAEALIGEVNVIQLMEDLTEAVASITLNVAVLFDTVRDADGNSVLQYSLEAVA